MVIDALNRETRLSWVRSSNVLLYIKRKKNLGFSTKCELEFNKEIKGNVAEESWGLGT